MLKKLLPLALVLLAIACSKDDPSSPGNSANVIPANFLSNVTYDKLIVEIQYVNGFQPAAGTVSNIENFLQQRLNKTGGIVIVQKAVASPGKTVFTLADLTTVESANRTQFTSGKTLTAYFFFADGDYTGNTSGSKTLGLAYGTSSMVIFEKTVKEFSGGLSQPSETVLESTVGLHEFGHILGLVNRGTATTSAHEDSAHEKHCNDTDCLMYYLAETSNMAGNLTGGTVPQLTASCLADLQHNGGK